MRKNPEGLHLRGFLRSIYEFNRMALALLDFEKQIESWS
jgi:hypothetical protein